MKKESFAITNNTPDQCARLYTKIGRQDFIDDLGFPRLNSEDNKYLYAKCLKNKKTKHFTDTRDQGYSYYVMTDPNKKIHNPIELHSIEPIIKKSFINQTCKSQLVFTEVTESIFNQYLNFLATENIQWLNHAQREIK